MSTHKYIDRICVAAVILSLLLTAVLMSPAVSGMDFGGQEMGYETKLFDPSVVHTIEIVMDDWDAFLDTCESEKYSVCSVIIDGKAVKNVAIRGKGNTSLSAVSSMNSDRYSFKIEFDHYDSNKSYFGLDKLSLNNLIQDSTYMKDYLTYRMMDAFGVDAPLCSYAYLRVNGEDWGLYLAVEGVEDAFLQRNYGSGSGELYKPDSTSMGGGRGNGMGFDQQDMTQDSVAQAVRPDNSGALPANATAGASDMTGQKPSSDGMQMPGADAVPPESRRNTPDQARGDAGGMGSDDVKLQYIDDDPASYSNIFDNAKTDITVADQQRLIESLRQLSTGENIETVVDVDEVIRYFVVHNFVCNGDSYTGSLVHNYYLYEEDGRLSMIPWDYNLAFGSFQSADATQTVNSPIDTPVSSGSSEDRPMLHWIFESEQYTQRYHESFAEFLQSTDFAGLIDAAKKLIAPYVEKDPTAFYTYEEFLTGVDTLRTFCLLRAQSVEGQLNGTIPATASGQAEDVSAMIDASEITLSDMGSMSGTGGGFGDGGNRHQQQMMPGGSPEEAAGMPQMQQGDGSAPPEGFDEQFHDDASVQMPDGADGQAVAPANSGRPSMENVPPMEQNPGGEQSDDAPDAPAGMQSDTPGEAAAVLLVCSAVVLILGLVIALLRRR